MDSVMVSEVDNEGVLLDKVSDTEVDSEVETEVVRVSESEREYVRVTQSSKAVEAR